MQRWIALATVMLVLLGAGGYFVRREYNLNQPDRIWCPIPIEKMEEADRNGLSKQLHAEMRKPARLSAIVKDLQLAAKFQVASEEQAVAELEKRVFVELGMIDTPLGARLPSLNVGVKGIRRENALLREISARQMEDVKKLLGGNSAAKPSF